ncbi:ABC transporter substrate-binding protein [Pseudonocardia sp.]|uniref:ABC transporter substrate-binding protein n=1 Tax=Pseudonocardia sp. TaxID=60912 RepID=UPI00260952F4|nr:ABC transporter substrate-binding protein [Pseudonocardia sp.]
MLAVAPLLAACGRDAQRAGPPPAVPAEVFPMAVDHKYGTATIPAPPVRVVTVGLTDHEAAIAVGVVPVGVTAWYGDAPGQIFPWASEAFGDNELPTVLSATELEVEQIAALEPDLIIGQYTGLTEEQYGLLTRIAPTVAQPADFPDYAAPWDVMATTIGTVLGRAEQMQGVVDDVSARIDAAAAAHPEFAGKQAVVALPYEGMYVLGPEDPKTDLLLRLGFDYPEEVFPYTEGREAGTQFSGESVPDLDELDLVMWLSLDGTQTEEVFETTDVAAEGRFLSIEEEDGSLYGVAINYYTPLSIPYVLDRLVPQLAAAIDGDPATRVPVAVD